MSNPLHAILLLASVLLGSGCQTLVSKSPAPEQPAEPSPRPLPYQSKARPPAEIDADLMFDYLAGQIGAQRGDTTTAYEHLLQAARRAKDPVAAAQAARMALKLEEPDKAAEATRLWIEYDPNSLPARQLATILSLRRNEMNEALKQADAAIKISEATGKDGFLQLATVLASEKLDSKIDLMQQLAQRHPNDERAWYALALVASQRKQFELAHQALDQAKRLKPDWDKPYLLQSQVHNLQGNSQAAEETLRTAARKHPSPFLLQALGRLLMQQERYEEATEAFQKAHRLDPDNQEILGTIGILGIQTRQWDVAREAWLKLAESNNDTRQQQAWYFLGQLEELQEHNDQAIRYYRRVKSGRFHHDAQLRLAILLGKQGDLDEASKLFRQIRLTRPQQAIQIFITEAQLYKELEKPEHALRIYSEAITANPDNPDLLYARGLLAADMGDIELAERDFKAVLRLSPDDTDALNALGYTLADQTDRLEEAFGYIRRAYEQMPDSAAILDSMGWVLYRMGKLEEALGYLEKASAKLEDGEIAAHLGEVLWMLGRKEEARKVWKKAQEHSPENPKLKQTIQRFL